tara:strand:- start:758 stop:1477 length:720 start_codon:yes stop_codon:yes gene_type:complete
MYRLSLILILFLSINFAAVNKLKLKSILSTLSKNNIELSIQSENDVMGIQFDLNYNPLELKFNGATEIPNGYIFEYLEKDNGIIRGLMFSLEGERINHHDIESLIAFEFIANNNFNGISTIKFLDVIIAGKYGEQLESSLSSININTSDLLPYKTALHSSFPNPFNPITQINYELANDGNISLNIYDALGRHVDELINGFHNAGIYNVSWNASGQSSGTYFIHYSASGQTMVGKIILIK